MSTPSAAGPGAQRQPFLELLTEVTSSVLSKKEMAIWKHSKEERRMGEGHNTFILLLTLFALASILKYPHSFQPPSQSLIM